MKTASVRMVSCASSLTVPGSGRVEDGPSPNRARQGVGRRRRLFTATLELKRGEFAIRMFHGCHAVDDGEVFHDLSHRMPASHLALVEVRAGIDAAHPVVRHLVPSATLTSLIANGDCCPRRRPLAMGGVLSIREATG